MGVLVAWIAKTKIHRATKLQVLEKLTGCTLFKDIRFGTYYDPDDPEENESRLLEVANIDFAQEVLTKYCEKGKDQSKDKPKSLWTSVSESQGQKEVKKNQSLKRSSALFQ